MMNSTQKSASSLSKAKFKKKLPTLPRNYLLVLTLSVSLLILIILLQKNLTRLKNVNSGTFKSADVQEDVRYQNKTNCPNPDQNCQYVKGKKQINLPEDNLDNLVKIPTSWRLTQGTKREMNVQYSIWHPAHLRFEDRDSGSMFLYNGDQLVFEIYDISSIDYSVGSLDTYYERVVNSGFYNIEVLEFSPRDEVQYSRLGFTNNTLFYQVTYPYFHTYESQVVEPRQVGGIDPPFSNYQPYKYYVGKAQGDYFVTVYDYQLLQPEEVEQILSNMIFKKAR